VQWTESFLRFEIPTQAQHFAADKAPSFFIASVALAGSEITSSKVIYGIKVCWQLKIYIEDKKIK
jgi:hypothetical protein